MKLRIVIAGLTTIFLSACETPTTQRYSISADNNLAIKSIGVTGIGISTFAEPETFDAGCRALGSLQIADGITHTQYIQKAFEAEMKIAGAYAPSPARVTLDGKIEKMAFSSSRGLTGGSWTIDLFLKSSNGSSMKVNEYYEFQSGFIATEACRNTAEAFSRAVQNLVGKTVRDPKFKMLVQ